MWHWCVVEQVYRIGAIRWPCCLFHILLICKIILQKMCKILAVQNNHKISFIDQTGTGPCSQYYAYTCNKKILIILWYMIRRRKLFCNIISNVDVVKKPYVCVQSRIYRNDLHSTETRNLWCVTKLFSYKLYNITK